MGEQTDAMQTFGRPLSPGVHGRRPLDTLAIILDFQGDGPENRPNTVILGH